MRIKQEQGFTLVEMVVATLVISIIMGGILSMLVISLKSYQTSKNVINVQYEGQLSFNALGKSIMEAEAIQAVYDSAGNLALTLAADLSDPQLLILRTQGQDSNGLWVDKYQLFHYHKSSRKIYYRETDMVVSSLGQADLGGSEWIEFSGTVDQWMIGTGVGNKSYAQTDNLEIRMQLLDGNARLELVDLFKLRNKTRG